MGLMWKWCYSCNQRRFEFVERDGMFVGHCVCGADYVFVRMALKGRPDMERRESRGERRKRRKREYERIRTRVNG